MIAMPCTPIGPLTMITSPGLGPLRTDVHPGGHQSDAGGVDVHLVAVAGVDHLGVPGDDADPGGPGGVAHVLGDPADDRQLGALLEHEPAGQVRRHGPAHRQVVDRAVHGQMPDRPAGEEQRPDHEGVGGEREPYAAELDHRRVGLPAARLRRRRPARRDARPARPTSGRRRRGPSRRAGCPAAAAGTSSPRSPRAGRRSATVSDTGRLPRRATGSEQPAVEVVRRAGALAGHHGGAERVARRALLAERRALVRLDQPLQHLAAAADGRLLGVDAGAPRSGTRRRTRGTSPTAASRCPGSRRCRASPGR